VRVLLFNGDICDASRLEDAVYGFIAAAAAAL